MRHISLSLCGNTPWYSNLFQYSTQAAPALGLRSMMLTTRGSGAPVRRADSIISRSRAVFSASSIKRSLGIMVLPA